MRSLNELHDEIAKIAPIEGISLDEEGGKEARGIQFKASATKEQREAAEVALLSYELKGPLDLEKLVETLVKSGVLTEEQVVAMRIK